MPAPYGVTATGFNAKTAEEALDEIKAVYRGAFGENVNLDGRLALGQIAVNQSNMAGEMWEALEASYQGRDPNQAVDQALFAIGLITGTKAKSLTSSQVILTCTGTPLTLLNSGRTASTSDLADKFDTQTTVTIDAADAWVTLTAYEVGDIVTKGSIIYAATIVGTSGATGPVGTDQGVTEVDATVTWVVVGDGTGFAQVLALSQETGSIIALNGTCTVIETPVSGWNDVYNLADAIQGDELETPGEFRVRRVTEIQSEENAPIDAIRETVLRVDDVLEAFVYENTTDVTDGFGLPPHSVEVVVRGGDTMEIAEAIFKSVAGGIQPYGTTTEDIIDDSGTTQTIGFTRPTTVPITVAGVLAVDTNNYPIDGNDQAEANILEVGNTYTIGQDVYDAALYPPCLVVDGVLTINSLTVNAGASVGISRTQVATFDSGNITITSTPGTP